MSDDKNFDGHPSEKPKPGLFKRLFGRKEAPAPEAGEVEAGSVVSPAEEQVPAASPEAEQNQTADRQEIAAPEPVQNTFAEETFAEETPEEPPPAETLIPSPKRSWWSRLREGLSRSSHSIGTGLVEIFTKRKLDDAMLEELEDVLIRADLGVATATRITKTVSKGRYDKDVDVDEVKAILAAEVETVLTPFARPLLLDAAHKPHIVLVVGVNGSGKTTTIAKLAAKFRGEGKKVILVAGDTFRAAAIEQLRIWGERLGCPVIARDQGGDAAGLAFDAIKTAKEEGVDVLLMDTAGRLQNRTELMAELEKIIRVMKKLDSEAPHSVLLVLDATIGQNAMNQVEIFGRVAGVTGLVMTKLDGTARGGILVAIADKFQLPIHFIGIGETQEDLQSFAACDFARAIAGIDS